MTLLVLGVAMWWIASRRMDWWGAGWLGVWTVLLAGSPRPLGFPLDFVTTAMFYNRLAEATLAIVAVGAMLAPREPRRAWSTSVWLTVPLGVLFATKLSYAAAAAAVVVIGGWVRQRPVREIAVTVAGAIAVCAALLVAIGVPPGAFVADMVQLVEAQDPGGRAARLARIISLNWPAMAALCASAAVAIRGLADRPREWRRILTVAGVSITLAVALCATNYQERDLPLVAVAAVVVAVRGVRSGISRRFKLTVVGVAAVLTGGLVVKELTAVGFAADLHGHPPRATRFTRVDAAPMADVLYVVPNWVAAIDDGIDAIEALAVERPRVLVTDLANPFSFALGLDPPRGDALWWHLGTTFSPGVHPPAPEVFATVNVVMEPVRAVDAPTVEAMWAIYGDHIRRHFDPVAETPYWTVWVRRE